MKNLQEDLGAATCQHPDLARRSQYLVLRTENLVGGSVPEAGTAHDPEPAIGQSRKRSLEPMEAAVEVAEATAQREGQYDPTSTVIMRLLSRTRTRLLTL